MRLSWFLMGCLAGAASAATPIAEQIFLNGSFITGAGLTGREPQRVSALAIGAGRVLFAGSDADVQRWRSPTTPVTDLHGAFAMPGFNDAHLHLADAGATALQTDLRGCGSLKEMLARIEASAQRAAAGAWLRGGGWDHTLWRPARLPTRAELDGVTAGHAAIFERVDGHIAIANSAALAQFKLTRASPDPPGGKLDRDTDGELTGILRETALDLEAKIPPPSDAERRQALEVATRDAVSHGVTSVQDYSQWQDFLVMEALEREGRLPVRVSEWLTFNDPLQVLLRERAAHAADDPLLHTGMLKGFMDGSLGSRTAALQAPYSDDPGNRGISRYPSQARLDELTIARARAGFQIGFHAIGDRGVAMALHAFAAAAAALPKGVGTRLRFRIEHDQVVTPAELHRQAALQVIASVQPSHLLTDMRWARQRLGPVRARYSYAWRSMSDYGIALAFGTDYPVEAVSPLRGLYAAVSRRPQPGEPGVAYFPEERLSVGEALYAYTQGSAFAENMEDRKGTLLLGQLADFVVLDRDLLKSTPRQIFSARVLRTVVGGRTVYESPAPGAP